MNEIIRLTKEQQDCILKEREKKQYIERLKAARARIIQGIERNNSRSGERAIWELMQNASDMSNEAIVKIELSHDAIKFSHQGKCFDMDTLSGLILQQSTKTGNEKQIGQYGTGFMTTHSFSRLVNITGDCCIKYEGNKEMYVPLPVDFCLDRTSDDEKEFINKLDDELRCVNELLEKTGNSEPCKWTTFSYQMTPEKIEKVKSQLYITARLMPFVLVFNDNIKECTIVNESSNETVCFTKFNRKISPFDFDAFHGLVVTEIRIKENGIERSVCIHSIESVNGSDRIIIPPLPQELNNTSEIPSQFLFFPLLGTEKFGINFIFHSDRLYPTEPRNSYQLPEDNDSLIKKYKENVSALDEMIDALFVYYRNNENRQCIPYDFARVMFEYKGEDKITADYFKKMQIKFSSEFLTWKIIPTIKGAMKVGDVKVLHPEVYKNLNKEQLDKYLPVIVKFASQSVILPSDNVLEWSQIVAGWTKDNDSCYVSIREICDNIHYKGNDLKTFLLFLKDVGQIGIELMESMPLIPNRTGILKCSRDLRDGKTITVDLYNIAQPILGTNADKLVDNDFASITSLTEYTRTDLHNEIKSVIDSIRKKTVNNTAGDNYHTIDPVLLEDSSVGVTIEQMIDYCSAFPTLESKCYRANMMPIISELYKVKYKKKEISPVGPNEPDLYNSVFNFLVENTMLMLSRKDSCWLTKDENHEDNSNLLFQFVSTLADTLDETRLEKLNLYGVIPNQLGELCKAKDLKKNISVCDALVDLYDKVFNDKLRSYFVDGRYDNLYKYVDYTKEDLGNQIEQELSRKQYEGTVILEIINHLYKGEWKDVFPNIDKQKEVIYYQHGSDDDKEALYRIQMQGYEKMRKIADLTSSEHFEEILGKAVDLLQQQKEQERQFRFTFFIGKLVEDDIRREVSNEVVCNYISVDDIQAGQDIVISYKGKDLFYIECKAKWNFSEPAHMSSLQIKRAVKEKMHYALCCIDCTNTGCNIPLDVTKENVEESHEEILNNSYVHTDIGELLSSPVSPLINQEDAVINSEEQIKVYGSLTCNIPKKVFVSGTPFKQFLTELKDALKKDIEEYENV